MMVLLPGGRRRSKARRIREKQKEKLLGVWEGKASCEVMALH